MFDLPEGLLVMELSSNFLRGKLLLICTCCFWYLGWMFHQSTWQAAGLLKYPHQCPAMGAASRKISPNSLSRHLIPSNRTPLCSGTLPKFNLPEGLQFLGLRGNSLSGMLQMDGLSYCLIYICFDPTE